MQILQVNFGDYIPRYQIFIEQEEDVDNNIGYLQTLYGQVVQSLASWQIPF